MPSRTLTGTNANWGGRRHIADTILETVGITPLVSLNRVAADVLPAILVKVELFGPTGV